MLERARLLRYCGIGKSGFEASVNKDRWWEYNIAEFSLKYLPSDISASIGLAQLRKLDALQAYRKQIWELYQKEFANLGWMALPRDPEPDETHSYFTYFVRLPMGKRDAFAKYLYSQGIYTTLRYHPLHMNPIYKSTARLPNCELLNETGLNIPLHPNLSSADVDKVIETIRAYSKLI
jgi:aminotransferase